MAPSTRRISTRSWRPTRPVPPGTSKALRLAARGPPCLVSQATVCARRATCRSSVQKEATMDLFLAFAYHDEHYASGLEDTLAGRRLVVGEPPSVWPRQRLLPQFDLRLYESRAAIVIVSP